MQLSLSAMRMLVAVVEERSFTAAAQRENATQSGVSQQIRKLEDQLGVALIVRERAGARPTPAGERLYRRCAAILRATAEAEDEARDAGRGLEGEASIGLMSALTRCALGPALRRFMDDHPNASIRVVEAISNDLIERVSASVLEAAVVPAIELSGALTGRPFPDIPEMFVSRAGRPADHMSPVELWTVKPLKLVLPPSGNLRTRRVLAHLAMLGVEIDTVLELDSMFAAFDFVANSDYAAVVPAAMVLPEIRDGSLCVRPLAGPPFSLNLMAIQPRRQALRPVAEAFLAAFEQQLRNDAQDWRTP